MMKRIVMLIFVLFCVLGAGAQSNILSEIESYAFGEGKVRVSQPEKLTALMGSMADGQVKQVEGYRVLVYSGNNSAQAREEAELLMYRLRATKKFKEISVKKCLINLPY